MTKPYRYQGCVVLRVADNVLINSNNPADADLVAYQAWAAAGNVPDPDPAYVAPIKPITPRQFLIQATTDGLITGVEALAANNTIPGTILAVIESLSSEQELAAKITWAKMTIIDRNEPLVDLVAAAFGLNSAQTDTFFRSAALR